MSRLPPAHQRAIHQAQYAAAQQHAQYSAVAAAAAAAAAGHMPNFTIPNDNDVLCGRGVNIAHHPGNERFRTLVISRRDRVGAIDGSFSMDATTASEKRQLAEEIIRHIANLDPSGRFLKRESHGGRRRGGGSRGKNGTGLDISGTWEVLSDREAMKKTCQALRDCSRTDRVGYAIGVQAPIDVMKANEHDKAAGIPVVSLSETGVVNAPPPTPRVPPIPNASGIKREPHLPPDVEFASTLLKKQKYEPGLPQAAPPRAPMIHVPLPPQPLNMHGGVSDPNAWSTHGQVTATPAPAPQFDQFVPAPIVNGAAPIPAPLPDPYGIQPQPAASYAPAPLDSTAPAPAPIQSSLVSAPVPVQAPLEMQNDWATAPAEPEGQLNPTSPPPPEVDISHGPLNVTEL